MNKESIAEAVKFIQTGYNLENEEYIVKAISSLRSSISTKSYTPPSKILDMKIEKPEFMKSGVDWLDSFLAGGLRKQELMLVAGVPHVGKTHLLSYIAGQFVINDFSVLHINGEDLMWDVAEIYKKILNGYDKEADKLYMSDMSDNKFSTQSVRDLLLEMKSTKPDIVVIDYMDIMHTPRRGQDWLEAEELTRDLRFLAKEFNVIILTASQMNYESSGGGRGLARLFRSKVGKSMNADIIITADKVDDNILALNIEKARGRSILYKNIFISCDWNTLEVNAA